MSSQGEYYGVEKHGDKWVAMYDPEQQLMGLSFDTEEEALAFVEKDRPKELRMVNKCTTCKTPLLASYCVEHEPSLIIRKCRKLSFFKVRIKLFFNGWHEYEDGEERYYD